MARNIVITGATGALGQACTQFFLDQGDQVWAFGSRNSSLERIDDHNNLHKMMVDLSNPYAPEQAMQSIAQQGSIDMVLMLAGGFAMNDLATATSSDMEHMININFYTAFNTVKATWPIFAEQAKGKFVFIGAKAAVETEEGAGMTPYVISKSMISRLHQQCINEGAAHQVKSLMLVPSIIDTEANRSAMPEADFNTWVPGAAIAAEIDTWYHTGNYTLSKMYTGAQATRS